MFLWLFQKRSSSIEIFSWQCKYFADWTRQWNFPGCSSLMIGDRRNQHKLKWMRCHLIILAKSLWQKHILPKQSCTNSGNELEIIQKKHKVMTILWWYCKNLFTCPLFFFIVTLVLTNSSVLLKQRSVWFDNSLNVKWQIFQIQFTIIVNILLFNLPKINSFID